MAKTKTQVIPRWNIIGSTRPADIFKVGNPVKQAKAGQKPKKKK